MRRAALVAVVVDGFLASFLICSQATLAQMSKTVDTSPASQIHPGMRAGAGLPSASAQSFANYLKPIETPLVFSGFSEDSIQRFAPQFAAEGIVPVMGVGSASDTKQPDPLEPGSAVSAILVRGDMDIAA